jgi:hypothetical protein
LPQGVDNNPESREGEITPSSLNYATPGLPGTSGIPPIYGVVAGVIAFASTLVQIPWAFFCMFFALGHATPGATPPPRLTIADHIIAVIEWSVVMFPTIFGLLLGAASIKVAGISPRNTLGILGLIFALIVISLAISHLFL